MGGATFEKWIDRELLSAKCALLGLYEKRDELFFVTGPDLEREYMEKVGSFEELVIQEEIECELLQEKQKMIQVALNRGEPIDESVYDKKIEQLRSEKMADASLGALSSVRPDLSPKEREEIKQLYRLVVQNFHPQVHSDASLSVKKLFEKAQEAYRRADLPALRLAYQMLCSTQQGCEIPQALLALLNLEEEVETERDETEEADYTLVSEIYRCFCPINKELSMYQEWKGYWEEAQRLMEEMNQALQQFPYSAAEMISDPEKTAAYREELEVRLRMARDKSAHRKREIRAMIERGTGYE